MKTVRQPQEPPRNANGDWTRAYILYRLAAQGWRIADIGRALEIKPRSAWDVFRGRSERVERKIAQILAVPLWEIFPSRYLAPQDRRSGRDRRSLPNRRAGGDRRRAA